MRTSVTRPSSNSVEQLRRLGHDVQTAPEAGQADQAKTDDDVLAFATAQRRTVVTFNRRQFIRLHHQVLDVIRIGFVNRPHRPQGRNHSHGRSEDQKHGFQVHRLSSLP